MAHPVHSQRSVDAYVDLFVSRRWDLSSVYRLCTIIRQHEDAQFAVALNNMVQGTMTAADCALFETSYSQVFQSICCQKSHCISSTQMQSMSAERVACLALDTPSVVETNACSDLWCL